MEKKEFLEKLGQFQQQLDQVYIILTQKRLPERLNEIRSIASADQFWQNPQKNIVLSEQSSIQSIIEKHDIAKAALEETLELSDLYSSELELNNAIHLVKKAVLNARTAILLSGQYDQSDCFVNITPGAGGTESQDWAQMLMRMVIRYAELAGLGVNILDFQKGQEAGIKSATMLIKGKFAYGQLKSENGVHRLVRISPFDSNKRRHTSFASIFVTPEVPDEKIAVKPEDIKIETFRAGGAGGQHVNTTDSAVRITHIKTGIVASCQNERSQGQNKHFAMKILLSRLVAHFENEKLERASMVEKKKIEWGSQIRSYVLHPYKLVKDHRTDLESPQPELVLDGELNDFIQAFLEHQASGGQ